MAKPPRIALLTAMALLPLGVQAQPLQPGVLFNFPRGPAEPYGHVVKAGDGSHYGTTYGGGSANSGTVFRVDPNGTLTTLVAFVGTNGAAPVAGLTLGEDGSLYGTTSAGGASFQNDGNRGFGTVFRVTTNGALTTLVSFNHTNGAFPQAPLTLGSDGSFYGTTADGYGSDGRGTVFKVTTSGALTTLVSFSLDDISKGINPRGLALGHDGHLYGTTIQGGDDGFGTVFRLTTDGLLTRLASFNGANGQSPNGLTLGSDGSFYGTTSEGGANGLGTVFKVTTNGALIRLVSFAGANGARPLATLTLGTDGHLYGTTEGGGAGDAGTVFRATTNGTVTTLLSFDGANGASPSAHLKLESDGNLYGTSRLGGSAYAGTVFRLTTNGTLTTLVSFAPSPFGSGPNRLVPGSDGGFYGTTEYGGSSQYGTLFRLTTNGALTTLVSFSETNGAFPSGALVPNDDGSFYGTTRGGGTNLDGTVFRVGPNGAVTTLVSFRGASGAGPNSLALGPDGSLYGTTSAGGGSNAGTAFRLTLDGTLTTLVSFNGTNGSTPNNLVLGPDGNFYGTTALGGTDPGPSGNGSGTVFRLATNGALTTLVFFSHTNGHVPNSLMLGADGNLYGTTGSGGVDVGPIGSGSGTVFRFTTNGVLTVLGQFGGTNGWGPSSLVLSGDGNLYGTTSGGDFNLISGTIFKLTTNGTPATAVLFNQTNGGSPDNLLQGSDGDYYGTTAYGGSDGLGTIFRVNLSFPFITVQPIGQTKFNGSNVNFSVVAFGTEPLNYYWRKDSTNLTDSGNILGASTPTLTLGNVGTGDSGSYSVTVSNHLGLVESSNATLVVVQTVPLAEALDCTNSLWSTGSDADGLGWFGQLGTTHDGLDAAQTDVAVPFVGAEVSWLQTTVTGPGVLSLWWRVSNSQGSLQLLLPGLMGPATTSTNWRQESISVPAGTHALRWNYVLFGPGQGSGWLDQVEFTPNAPTIGAYELLEGGQFRLRFESAPGAAFSVLVSTNLMDWTALGPAEEVTPGHFEFTEADVLAHAQRFYQLRSP